MLSSAPSAIAGCLLVLTLLAAAPAQEPAPPGSAASGVTTALATPSPTLGAYLRPYTPGSMDQLVDRALEEVRVNYPVVRGTPEVVLATRILATQFGPLGLPDVLFPDNDPLLALIIVRGNFGWPESGQQLGYIGFTYDMLTGRLLRMDGSFAGALFSRLLHDPSIPYNPMPATTPIPRPQGRPTELITPMQPVLIGPGDFTAPTPTRRPLPSPSALATATTPPATATPTALPATATPEGTPAPGLSPLPTLSADAPATAPFTNAPSQ
ncbi:MAG TPA: hypothetical protein VK066_18295 [Chloroflexota bacterium]|nr:hypothetical protein [Chloroflexota bacterium]